jgi:hypothetical protein
MLARQHEDGTTIGIRDPGGGRVAIRRQRRTVLKRLQHPSQTTSGVPVRSAPGTAGMTERNFLITVNDIFVFDCFFS